jgi:hypothetical protein
MNLDNTEIYNISKLLKLSDNETYAFTSYMKSIEKYISNYQYGGVKPEHEERKYIKNKSQSIIEKKEVDTLLYVDTITYRNLKFKFLVYQNKNKHITIKITNKKHIECIIIFIDSSDRNAIIMNISNEEGCIQEGMIYKEGGKILVQIAIKYLKTYKDKFNINRILLSDMSFVKCTNNISEKSKRNMILSDLYMLTHGDTWYGKFGFKPFDVINNEPSRDGIIEYVTSKKIINNIKLKDYNKLYKLIIEADKSLNINYFKENELKLFMKDNQNSLIKDILKILFKKKFPFCIIFEYIKRTIMNDLNIKSFHEKTLYLDI